MTREYTSAGWRDGTTETIYGIEIDADVPIGGVISNHDIGDWLSDACYSSDAIDLGWEDAMEDYRAEHGGADPDCEAMDDMASGDISGPHLVGDWTRDDNGEWSPDRSGSHGFSAIVGEVNTQVLWSKSTARAHHCSPCYPGQADIGTPGRLLAYTLPSDCFDR